MDSDFAKLSDFVISDLARFPLSMCIAGKVKMSAPHPTTVVLPEPINVSPLIRFSRWTALGLGFLWGAYRLHQIREYHADIRQWEHEKAVAAAEEAAKKKKWLAKDEMRYLMQVCSPLGASKTNERAFTGCQHPIRGRSLPIRCRGSVSRGLVPLVDCNSDSGVFDDRIKDVNLRMSGYLTQGYSARSEIYTLSCPAVSVAQRGLSPNLPAEKASMSVY